MRSFLGSICFFLCGCLISQNPQYCPGKDDACAVGQVCNMETNLCEDAPDGGGGGTEDLAAEPGAPASITITAGGPTLARGAQQQLVATGRFDDGSTSDITKQVTWASSNPMAATISNAGGSQGLVTGAAPGTASITATLGGRTGTSVLSVVVQFARFNQPYGVTADGGGNVYVADTTNHTIRKIAPGGFVSTLAGSPGAQGSTDGPGSAARFSSPIGVAVDGGGNLYVADYGNHAIRKISPAGIVSTLAGLPGMRGSADGNGAAARFNEPYGVALDSGGNLYVTDSNNATVRKITPAGAVSTVAGAPGVTGSTDGNGAAARFNHPYGVAVDGGGSLYVADGSNSTLRKITPAGAVSTLAGSPGMSGVADGNGAAARFNNPSGVAVDGAGVLYVTDAGNSTLRKVTAAGAVSTLAGSAGASGSADGAGGAARFFQPGGVAMAGGILYVADSANSIIRKVTATGAVTTFAGLPTLNGSLDGSANSARFYAPWRLALDGAGNLYVTDSGNHTIRKITPAGVVSTIAGAAGVSGTSDGVGAVARFNGPFGVTTDVGSNLYVTDCGNSTIRKIAPSGLVSTLAGFAGMVGTRDGVGTAAQFRNPDGMATDRDGNMYVADYGNNTIRKITPANDVSTLAGSGGMQGSADGAGGAARFNGPQGVTVDGDGNVYVADSGNNIIRKITQGGVVSTLAGATGVPGLGSRDGVGGAAQFNFPQGLAADGSGNLYVADKNNSTIRKITPAGLVTTFAGLATVTGSADGAGTAARFNQPYGVAVDGGGNVYVADSGNQTIRMILPSGLVMTLAGLPGVQGGVD